MMIGLGQPPNLTTWAGNIFAFDVCMMAATRILGQFGAFVVHVLRNQRYVFERCAYKEQYEQC